MQTWLRAILEHLMGGLVPVDGDYGRRAPVQERDRCPDVEAVLPAQRPLPEETAWIPRATLYGPPL